MDLVSALILGVHQPAGVRHPAGLGLFLIAAAVKNVVGDPASDLWGVVATAVGLLGFIALLFEPRWWGPRWYHDLQASNPQRICAIR
jgi:hypothetical protein